jgi:hypothetical protein
MSTPVEAVVVVVAEEEVEEVEVAEPLYKMS